MADQGHDRELKNALSQIEKQFGKGAIMQLGQGSSADVQGIPTGALSLDIALGGRGLPRGRIIEIFGPESSGKTTLAASFADAACRRGERCLFIDFEESSNQVARNMKSVGIDLQQWSEKGLLFHEAWRPTQSGIEMHLLRIHKLIERVKPQCVRCRPEI